MKVKMLASFDRMLKSSADRSRRYLSPEEKAKDAAEFFGKLSASRSKGGPVSDSLDKLVKRADEHEKKMRELYPEQYSKQAYEEHFDRQQRWRQQERLKKMEDEIRDKTFEEEIDRLMKKLSIKPFAKSVRHKPFGK